MKGSAGRWPTVLAICSIICTIAALVCLALLVFSGTSDDDSPVAAPATSSAEEPVVVTVTEESNDNADGATVTTSDDSSSLREERCTLDLLHQAAPADYTQIEYCDGTWAYVAVPHTSAFGMLNWSDGQWARRDFDGITLNGGGFACFDEERLREDGVPYDEMGKVELCGDDAAPNPYNDL